MQLVLKDYVISMVNMTVAQALRLATNRKVWKAMKRGRQTKMLVAQDSNQQVHSTFQTVYPSE